MGYGRRPSATRNSKPAAAGRILRCVTLLSLAATLQAETTPQLRATFLQLWSDHWSWTPDRWRGLFQHFQILGLREVYVQWSLHDQVSYTVAGAGQAGRTPPLTEILRQASQAGMQVHVGLSFESAFWQQARPGPELAAYLERQRARSLAAAAAVVTQHGQSNAFAGWYLAEEIDDLMWPEGEPRQLLQRHCRDLVAALKQMTPAKPVTISGYAGARTEPAQLTAFWRDLLAVARFDAILFQDGIGVGNLPLAYLRQYLDAMTVAVQDRPVRFRVIVETFRQVDGVFNGRSFRALPVPFAFLLPQLQAAAPYSADGLVAFSVPEYLTPFGGTEAASSYQSYLAWLRSDGGLLPAAAESGAAIQ